MIAASHFLFMALIFPPLPPSDFFPLPLETLFFQPLTLSPRPLGFLRMTIDTLLIAVVVLLTPVVQFTFLLNAPFLPVTFLRQALLMQAFPLGLFAAMSGVSGITGFPVIPGITGILVMAAGILSRSSFGQINIAAELQQPD
jgi:hypothetical protein